MMKKALWVLLALSIGVNLGLLYGKIMPRDEGPPPREGPRGGPRPGGGHMVEEQLRVKTQHLQLDEAQQQALKKLLEERLPEVARLRELAAVANQEMARIFTRDPFDAELFREAARQATLARGRADSLSTLILSEEAAILDAQQRRLFAKEGPLAGQQRPPGPPRGPRR